MQNENLLLPTQIFIHLSFDDESMTTKLFLFCFLISKTIFKATRGKKTMISGLDTKLIILYWNLIKLKKEKKKRTQPSSSTCIQIGQGFEL